MTALRCPHCHAGLHRSGRVWRCPSGHAFDVARQGYVNLLPGPSAHAGDSVGMLQARAAVLEAGHFAVVTETLLGILGRRDLPDGVVVEVGAGTAHHLDRVLAATRRQGVALDVSKAAARLAARTSPAVTAVVADVWQPWPLLDGVAAAVLHVFAPRNVDELHRVLAPGGVALVTLPAPDHLRELVAPLDLLGSAPPARKLPVHPGLLPEAGGAGRTERLLSREEAEAVIAMGPNAHHIDPQDLAERVARLPDPVRVTIAVDVAVFRRRR